MDWDTNSTILQRLHDFGAQTAWGDLEGKFSGPLARLAERSGCSADQALDVVQDVLLAFAQAYRSGKFDPQRAKLRDWLFGIARVQIQRARARAGNDRMQAVGSATFEANPLDSQNPTDLERIWEEEWQRALIDRALGLVRTELSPDTLEVFRLRTIEGLSSSAVAERLSIPIGRVYNAHSRVLQRLSDLRAALDDA